MSRTQYEVAILYKLNGLQKAFGDTKALGAASDKTARSLEWIKRAAIGVGAGFAFSKMHGALIGANRELQSMQISMSTVLASSLEMPFLKAEPIAARLVDHYREIAKISPGTADDFIKFNNLAMGAVTSQGGTIGQLKKITEGGVIASKAFGFSGEVGARDVQQGLTGNVSMQTPMLKMLLGSEKKIAEFNRMSGEKRIAAMVKMFDSPVLKDAAKRYGESYEGQMSTLKDNTDNLFRKIGKPLFDQLTKWLKEINKWADSNQGKINAFAKSVGEGLAFGARWLVKAVGFAVENKGVLLAIAGAFVGLKMAGGALGGGGVGLGGALQLATVGALGFYRAGMALSEAWPDIMGRLRGDALDPSYKNTNKEINAYDNAYDNAFWSGKSDLESRQAGFAAQNAIRGPMRFARQVEGNAVSVGGHLGRAMDAIQGYIGKRKSDDDQRKPVEPRTPKMTVVIKRVEVVADDADRFIHKLVGAIDKELRSPSQWNGAQRAYT